MTNRRDFIKMLALLAAGQAAMPSQIAAFERYYEANTPQSDELIAIDSAQLSGLASTSTRLLASLWRGDQQLLPLSINAFGGIFHWTAPADQKIPARPREVTWKMSLLGGHEIDDYWVRENLDGSISYIDQNAKRHFIRITTTIGTIG